MSDSLHGLQHTRPPCPSPTPRVYSNSCPLSRWCHPTISSSVIPFSSCLQSFQASGSLQMSQLFTSRGQRIGVSASASVLPMNIQDWFPLGWTGWISLQSKGLSRVFSNTIQKHQFFGAQLYSPTLTFILHTLGHKTSLNKFKTEIILSVFSEHNGMKLVINKKARKYTNKWKLNNIFLNQCVQKKRHTPKWKHSKM